MHYLYIVAVKKERDTEKENLLNEVRGQLEQEGFASEGGFWSGSKSDWFVMGGRWSGHLQEIKLKDWHKKANELVKKGKKDTDFISQQDIDDNKDALQELWVSLGGKGQNPWNRDTYNHFGEEDDCMLLDQELYKALKERNLNDTEVAIYTDGYIENEMLLKDWLEDETVVNNYYLCVVDYHN
jgi:hypothetical protein